MIGRIFRIVRTPITLLVLLGVLLWAAWWGYTNVLRPIPPIPAPPCVEQTVARGVIRSGQVIINVYNGGDRNGLAGEVGRQLRNRGFKVPVATNTNEKISKTVIVGGGAKNPEVLFVKTFFKDSVVRADSKRKDGSVDVLVGNKYGGFVKAKTAYAVKTKTVCLPSQTPTPTTPLGG